MKKVLRWCIFVLVAAIVLVIAAILSLDTIARRMAEKHLRQETGMEARIGKFEIDFTERSIHIENLRLTNPPEFGGSTFLDIPELHVQADWDAIRSNRLQIALLRVTVADIHLVRNKEGRRNIDLIQSAGRKAKKPGGQHAGSSVAAGKSHAPPEFGGIGVLQFSLQRARVTDEQHPARSFDRDLGVRDAVYRDIRTEEDLKVVSTAIAMKAGLGLLMEGMLKSKQDP